MTVALYTHHAPEWGDDELRYSLRTAHRFLGIDEVVIIGDVPSWARNVGHIPEPHRRHADKFAHLWDVTAAACRSQELAADFVLMNDDYHALRAYGPKAEHRGYLAAQIGHIRPLNVFFETLASTLDYLERERGIAEPLSYDTHRPLPMRKAEVAAAIDDARGWNGGTLCARSVWGNVAGIGGRQVQDVKVPEELPPSDWYHVDLISTSDAAWQGRVGAWLREQSPEPSPWEA